MLKLRYLKGGGRGWARLDHKQCYGHYIYTIMPLGHCPSLTLSFRPSLSVTAVCYTCPHPYLQTSSVLPVPTHSSPYLLMRLHWYAVCNGMIAESGMQRCISRIWHMQHQYISSIAGDKQGKSGDDDTHLPICNRHRSNHSRHMIALPHCARAIFS